MEALKRWLGRGQRNAITIQESSSSSSLCKACISFNPWTMFQYPHQRSASALRGSSRTCKLCRLLYSAIVARCPSFQTYELRYRSGNILVYLDPEVGGERVASAKLDILAEAGSSAIRNDPTIKQFPDRVGWPERISTWLTSCKTLHPHCACPNPKIDTELDELACLPTRVIDVGPSDGARNARLLETNGQRGQYVTLSHCWGHAKFLTTTSFNIESMKHEIPYKMLCQNFKDAITVTRHLGFQYIWIDSLCIIQNSLEDWDRESAQMGNIYLCSTLTICASEAKDGNAGFLHQRGVHDFVKMPYLNESGTQNGSYFISQHWQYFDELRLDSILETRGWTLQEQFFARRRVLFSKGQLYWECEEGFRSEVDGESFQYGRNEISNFIGPAPSPESVDTTETTHLKFSLWRQIVERYSRRDLTFENDKLSAIAGLARFFHQYSGAHYMAGIWEEDLHHSLLWSVSMHQECVKRPSSPRAPTWSWASLDAAINFATPRTKYIFHISDIKFEAIYPGSDTFGRVEPASLTLDGLLQPVRLTASSSLRPESSPTIQYYDLRLYARNKRKGFNLVEGRLLIDNMDEVGDLIAEGLELYGLFIRSLPKSLDYRPIDSLLLQKTAQPLVFRRVGVFASGCPDFYQFAKKERLVII